jgi:glycosyltransferase involved in cell wall biosynthesis
MNKKISVVTPTFNEAENIVELCDRIATVMRSTSYDYEHIVIDNASIDNTVGILRERAAVDPRLKVIVNTRNFGHIRSPFHGVLQASGNAVVILSSDLQDPPELIPQLVEKWESGYKIAMLVKKTSNESLAMKMIRGAYYSTLETLAEIPLIKGATGHGLYDESVIQILRSINDPYPYFRGIVCEIGLPIAQVQFDQPRRKRGITSQNFYSLFDMAMLGMVKHSKLPLRMMTFTGLTVASLSLLTAIYYLIYKLAYWNSFDPGQAPIVIGMFFFISVIMIFFGIIGEYLLSIHDHVRGLPHVYERERINLDSKDQ